MRQVLIIGGGASGLMAAVTAARGGAKVTVLEKQSQAGKKILATGNGRCNLTNTDQRLFHYRCPDMAFPAEALGCFGAEETRAFFHELGILTKDKNGYVYPWSGQARDVAFALRLECEHQKVRIACSTRIEKLEKKDGRFYVHTPGWVYEGDALLLACGSLASADGSGDGYVYAESFGHAVRQVLPALVQLRGDPGWPAELAGVRLDAVVRLYAESEEEKGARTLLAEDGGEVQLTAYGISGIPVFQVSRFAAEALAAGRKVEAELCLLPLYSREETGQFLERRRQQLPDRQAAAWLAGLFPRKLIPVLLKRAAIAGDRRADSLAEEELQRLAEVIHAFRIPILAPNGFDQAQVCAGGVDVSQVNGRTMESRLVPGLYLAGELLDVDGACGGYNLQWAWTSGYLAGRHAAAGELFDHAGDRGGTKED